LFLKLTFRYVKEQTVDNLFIGILSWFGVNARCFSRMIQDYFSAFNLHHLPDGRPSSLYKKGEGRKKSSPQDKRGLNKKGANPTTPPLNLRGGREGLQGA
jgi:hypothetical protein